MSVGRRLRVVVLTALAVIATLVVACASVAIPGACRISIAALPPGSTVEVGEPLPAGAPLLIGPADLDPTKTGFAVDSVGQATLDIGLQGDAIARFGAHTAGHIGGSVAVAIDDRVVMVPVILAPIPDGEVRFTLAGDEADLAERAPGCRR